MTKTMTNIRLNYKSLIEIINFAKNQPKNYTF